MGSYWETVSLERELDFLKRKEKKLISYRHKMNALLTVVSRRRGKEGWFGDSYGSRGQSGVAPSSTSWNSAVWVGGVVPRLVVRWKYWLNGTKRSVVEACGEGGREGGREGEEGEEGERERETQLKHTHHTDTVLHTFVRWREQTWWGGA